MQERRRLLDQTKRDIRSLNAQTQKLENEIKQLQEEYDECSGRYADACRFYQHQQISFNPVTFLFSSSTFKELTRRMRYISEYYEHLYKMGEKNSSGAKFSMSRSNMNQLAFFIEKFHDKEIKWKIKGCDFDYHIMMDDKIIIDEEKKDSRRASYARSLF